MIFILLLVVVYLLDSIRVPKPYDRDRICSEDELFVAGVYNFGDEFK